MIGQAGWAHILSLSGKHDSDPRDRRLVPNSIKRNAEEMETYDQGPTTASEKDVDCLGSWLHVINLLILSIIYFTSSW